MKKKFSICGPIIGLKADYKNLDVPYNCPVSREKIIQDSEYIFSKNFLEKILSRFC